jgi:putative ABC transport system permease protein
MTPWEAFRLALRSIALHKLRSFLTALGVIFGVGAVISMMAISEGARRETLEQIEALGIRNIRLKSVPPARDKGGGQNNQFVLDYGLKIADLDHLRAACPDLVHAVPLRDLREPVWSEGKKTDFKPFATVPAYLEASELQVEEGRFLSPLDESGRLTVCVLGARTRRALFRARPALGEKVKVGDAYFRVVGVMAGRSTAGAIQGRDVDSDVYIPFETFVSRMGSTTFIREAGRFERVRIDVDEAILQMGDVDRVEAAAPRVRRAVERLHPKSDVEVVIPLELFKQREATQRIFQLVMISIAAISLLVGGIGIMNIMLAGVVERTKEIGTRRALGARKRDVLVQFLFEAVVLALLGGILGVAFGLGAASAIASAAGWRMATTWASILAAFLVSAATGVVFGTYPAWRAAGLDPIESLRSE